MRLQVYIFELKLPLLILTAILKQKYGTHIYKYNHNYKSRLHTDRATNYRRCFGIDEGKEAKIRRFTTNTEALNRRVGTMTHVNDAEI